MRWVNDPDVVGKFEWYTGHTSRDEEQELLEHIITSNDRVYSVYDNQAYIGQVGLHEIENNSSRMSIVLEKNSWGKGYGTRAINAVTQKAFDDGINMVWATPRAENTKMQHITEKCGYRREAFLEDAYTLRGKTYDLVKMVKRRVA